MKLNSLFLSLLISLVFFSCNKESSSQTNATFSASSSSKKSVSAQDDFSDLEKKKDESCDTTEDLEKKIVEKAKKQEAFKLQGGDPGCTTD